MHTRTSIPRRLLALVLCLLVMAGTVVTASAASFSPKTETPEPTAASAFEFSNGEITDYTGSDTDVVIPAAIDGVTVTKIGQAAFMAKDIENVVIPSTVTSIGNYAFDYCSSLDSLYFYGDVPANLSGATYDMSISGLIYCKGTYLSDYQYEVGDYFSVSGTIKNALEDPAYPAAPTHNYKYTDNGDGTHTGTCSDAGCTETVTEKHTFENAVCTLCGAEANVNDPSFFNYKVANGEATIIGYNANGLGGEITLPETYTDENGTYPVTAIGDDAFNGNGNNSKNTDAEALSKITKITVPASITTVGARGFNYVGRYASRLWSLQEIVFEAENVTFGSAALGGNPNLTSVTLPSKLTEIGSSMFSKDTALTEFTIGASVTKIGAQAFSGCTALKTVTFEGTTPPEMAVTTSNPDGNYPFAGLTQEIILSVPKAKLDDYNTAWSAMLSAGTTKAGNITVATWGEDEPDPIVGSIPDFKVYVNGTTADSDYPKYMEYHVVSFDNATKSGTVELKYVGWNKDGGTLDIPETVTTKVLGKDWTFTVIGIGKNAMFSYEMTGASSNYWFSTVNFPSTLKYIGKGGCWSLERVTEIDLSNTKVTSIGSYAFYGCQKAETVKLPNTLESMGGDESSTVKRDDDLGTKLTYTENVFACCDALKEIIVSDDNPYFKTVGGVLYSKDGTKLIRYPTGLPATHFDIPEGVEVIAEQAFMQSNRGTGALTTVSFPSTLKEIESLAFRQSNLTEVTLPVGVKFGSSVFDISKKLAKVTIPEGVTEIGEYMFWSCEALTELKCPTTLVKIGANAFGHTGLTDIDLATVQEIGDYAFYSCPLTKITIPNTANTLGKGIFAACSKLETAIFSNNCKTVGAYMFASDAALATLVMPDSIETIGDGAFSYCFKLDELTMPASLREMGEGVFYKASRLQSVIFPDSVTITKLPANTFESCQALTYLHLGKNIKATGPVSLYDTNAGLVVNSAVSESEFTRSPFDVFPYDLDDTAIIWKYEESGNYQDGYPVYNVWMIDEFGNKLEASIPVNAGATPTFKFNVAEPEEPVVLTVYKRTGVSGEKETVKTYTRSELKALVADGAPAAGYQFWKEDANYTAPVPNIVVATGYVTIETLMQDAGLDFGEGDTLTAADRSDYTSVVSYEELQSKNLYFDGTTENGVEVPAAIAVCWNSAKNDAFPTLFEKAAATAYESGNLRFCYGISKEEIGAVPGKRLASNVVSLTVTYPEPVKGDANGDGVVNLMDASTIYSFYLGNQELTDEQLKLADVNGDGKVNLMDASTIYSNYLGNNAATPAA